MQSLFCINRQILNASRSALLVQHVAVVATKTQPPICLEKGVCKSGEGLELVFKYDVLKLVQLLF